jgi:uncharacterized protein
MVEPTRRKNIGGLKLKKKAAAILFLLLVVLTGSVFYNIYDNHRFLIVEQEIDIERLPPSFDGFRILQISDLHGSYFGENQADLVRAINSIEYDMIALTGDMNASTEIVDSLENSKAVLDLLDGIVNKETVFWIDGNAGPYAIESYVGAMTGDLTPIGTVLQAKGCKILTLPHALTRGNERIWITPEMSEIGFSFHFHSLSPDDAYVGGKENYDRIQSFLQKSYQSYQDINGNGEAKILLIHTPKQTNSTAEEREQGGDLDYDLILAGHYHGGQLRLPLIGALYIPAPTAGINNSGYFPAQNDVKGLSYYGRVPQYVSAGLGASGHIRLASFRLFNTPEINLITLRRR